MGSIGDVMVIRERPILKCLGFYFLCLLALFIQTMACVTNVRADDPASQAVSVGSINLRVPTKWLPYFEINLVSGESLVSEPSDKPYAASLVSITAGSLDTSSRLGRLRLPGRIDLVAIPSDAQSLYDQRLSDLLTKVRAHQATASASNGHIWEVSPGSHVVVGSESSYRMGQPLVVDGSPSQATATEAVFRIAYARYRIAPDVAVRLMFDLKDFPPDKWMEMDRDTRAFIAFLRQPTN